jgi:acyl carrier protein
MSDVQSTAERIKAIMRRDLKLGPTAELPDDLPLIGGQFDLDPLDMLMLVTSMEKEFGIKVSDQSIGRDAFKTISTLAAFVDRAHASGSKA